ncbi:MULTISPECIES: hypothetical protein [Brevibacterium]|uniref:Uncharacterized protein n=1 Tax=Brevibacterium casei TaxID=33889 RepID=A0A7T3ZY81_9MICO|nr:hypothetical protein [Brevibacterium casei]QQB13904.1 hypothetical protein I6H47_14145 [Brevibacterium casei]
MRSALKPILLPLFTLAMAVFLTLAFAIVVLQIIGLAAGQGEWIDAAYAVLARPSIIAAIAVSLLGYAYFTTTSAKADD